MKIKSELEKYSVFLLDIYQSNGRLYLWLITEENKRICVKKEFKPYFYIRQEFAAIGVMGELEKKFGKKITFFNTVKKDINRILAPVAKCVCDNILIYDNVVEYIRKSGLMFKALFYNIELSAVEIFLYENRLFPFGCFLFDSNSENITFSNDNHENTEFIIPNLRILEIKPVYEYGDPTKNKGLPAISLNFLDGREYIVEKDEFKYIDEVLAEKNPDIVITEYGDSILMRAFYKLGFKNLNRMDNKATFTNSQSFVSYGKKVFRAGAAYLKGRIHIDKKNSFFYKETGIEGLIELARISAMSVSKISRTSPGTVITAIETRKAFENNLLIPSTKTMPEKYKTAKQLIKTDKGGLSFRPPVGFFENVCELDFFSMYPSIMVNCNLSYETIDCIHKSCRKTLPQTDYRICTQVKGIVPEALEFILKRRKKLKNFMLNSTGEEREYYNKRQIALKWLLVVSFGYMGYKNARFGRIESHEAITAMGRELLLEAKEIAENIGFTMLHALTDAMWVTKKGAVRKDYENLKNLINLKVNQIFPKIFDESMPYEIVIEGVYKWIIFIESKKDKIGVSNRFLGLFDDFTYKIRGIELRRRDTPMFIKEFQAEILEIMKNINSKNDFRKLSKQIWQMFDDYSEKICNGKIPAEKLCVKKRMSKNPLEYKKNTDISQAAQTLIAEGIDINPGESINLIFVQGNQALPYEIFIKNPQPLNTEKYIKLLKESMIILT